MNHSLSHLRTNLQEIWSSLQDNDGTTAPIVPNYSGTHVYDSRVGYGRLWRWFYNIIGVFCGVSGKNKMLAQALSGTQKLFQEKLKEMQETAQEYTQNLRRIAEGRHIDEKKHLALKKKIVEWNNSTRPLVKTMLKLWDENTLKFLNPTCKRLFEAAGADIAPFFSPEAIRLINCQKVIDLEEEQTPYHPTLLHPLCLAVARTVDKQAIKEEEDRKITAWIGTAQLSQKGLRQGIAAMTKLFANADTGVPPEAIHYLLQQKGYKIYQETDPKLLKRIHRFISGTQKEFKYDRTVCKVDKSLQDNQTERDFYCFTLENQPGRNLLVGKNKFILPLKRYSHIESGNVQLENCSLKYISKDGAYALMGSLIPLQGYQWKSAGANIHNDDKSKADSIAKFLHQWLNDKIAPKDLLTNFWFFNIDEQLALFETSGYGNMNFVDLEKFAIECSNGNDTIRKYLYKQSGMATSRYAIYFNNVIESALAGQPFNFKRELYFETGIYNDAIVDRAQEVYKTVTEQLDGGKTVEGLRKAYREEGYLCTVLP